MLPNSIQSRESSRDGGADAIPRIGVGAFWVNPNRNRHALVLNENAGERNVNLNWNEPENRWNGNYHVAVVSNSLHAERCLRQPPSIFPVSASGAAIAAYFL